MLGAVGGATNAVMLMGAILGSRDPLPPTRLGHALERVPFLVAFAMKFLVYGTLVVLVNAARPGGAPRPRRRRHPAQPRPRTGDVRAEGPKSRADREDVLAPGRCHLHAPVLGRLVGERTLRDIVLGRYHRPHTEERFFLFVDVAGSTPPRRANRPRRRSTAFFARSLPRSASDPIDDSPRRSPSVRRRRDRDHLDGNRRARRRLRRSPFFAIEQALALAAPEFEHEFGTAPRLRAALHGGPVITGEVGGSRRAIVYHGDVMNTTSRIEQARRESSSASSSCPATQWSGSRISEASRWTTSAFSDCVAALRPYASTRSRPSPQRMASRRYEWNRDCRTHGMPPTAFGRG